MPEQVGQFIRSGSSLAAPPAGATARVKHPERRKNAPAPQLSPSVMRASYSIVVFDYCVGKAGSLGYIYLSLTH